MRDVSLFAANMGLPNSHQCIRVQAVRASTSDCLWGLERKQGTTRLPSPYRVVTKIRYVPRYVPWCNWLQTLSSGYPNAYDSCTVKTLAIVGGQHIRPARHEGRG